MPQLLTLIASTFVCSAAIVENGFTTSNPGSPVDAGGSLVWNASFSGDGSLLEGVAATSLSFDLQSEPLVVVQYNLVVVDTNLQVTGDWIKFLGYKFAHATGSKQQNLFVGINSGLNASGYPNVAFGPSALYAITTGIYNTAFGNHTLDELKEGSFNTAFGTHALNRLTNGWYNTTVGEGALEYLHQGTNNLGAGMYAGVQQMAGRDNSWVGGFSGSGAFGTNYRTSTLGAFSGTGLMASEDNVMVGYSSGTTDVQANKSTNSSQVVFLGNYSGASTPKQITNAVAIGFKAKVANDNQAALGELLSFGIGTNDPQAKLHVRGYLSSPAIAIDESLMAEAPSGSSTGLVIRVNGTDYVLPLYCP